MIPIVSVDDGYGSFSAGQGHEVCWSNTMRMTGQVECNWVDKSVHYPAGSATPVSFRVETPPCWEMFPAVSSTNFILGLCADSRDVTTPPEYQYRHLEPAYVQVLI